MTENRQPYNTYSKEFKLEALRMMNESARPASEVAMKLGLDEINFISGKNNWKRKAMWH